MGHYNAHLSLAEHQKDATRCISLLKSILPLMANCSSWDYNSPLYKNIKPLDNAKSIISSQILSGYLQIIQTDKEYEFMSSNPDFLDLVKQYS